MERTGRKKMSFEAVFDSFQTWARSQLEEVPELQNVCLVANWRVAKQEFPAGYIVGEGGPIPTCELLVQLARMSTFLSQNLAEQAGKAAAQAKENVEKAESTES